MSTLSSLERRLAKLENRQANPEADQARLLAHLRRDPSHLLRAEQMVPDAWQSDLLRSWDDRVLMLCSRQSGKSKTASALALRAALLEAPALVLLLSPTLRQSGELFRDKLLPLWRALGCPFRDRPPSQLAIELSNGSRIISLPGEEGNIRCYSGVRLLCIDEAARVPDALYHAVRPMIAVSKGRLVCLSSAWAKAGWYYQTWTGTAPWRRVKVTALECPRITPEFLAEERDSMPAQLFSMEYLCEFGEATDAVFRLEDLRAATAERIPPLFGA